MTNVEKDRIKGDFGTALRKLREKAALSQERLADIAEIHRTYVGDVERGERNIALVNMVRLAKALKMPLSRIVAEMEKLANP